MLRRLLTLLALCAGLAAVSEPARASITAVDSVGLVEQTGRACGVAAPAIILELANTVTRADSGPKICPRPGIPVVVPTVMLHVDRARE